MPGASAQAVLGALTRRGGVLGVGVVGAGAGDHLGRGSETAHPERERKEKRKYRSCLLEVQEKSELYVDISWHNWRYFPLSKWDFSFSISIHIARCHFGCTKVRTAISNSRRISCTTVRLLSLTSNFCGLDFSDQTPCPAEKTSISSSKTYHLTMSSHDAIIAPPPSYVDELLN